MTLLIGKDLVQLVLDSFLDGYYAINKYGAILNIKRNRILYPHSDKNGYLHLMLCTNDVLPNGSHKRVDFRVASLVAKMYIGLPPDNMKDPTVDHIDNNKKNNFYLNLRWLERGENSSFRNNTGKGESNHEAKLTELQVHDICSLLEKGNLSLQEIATLHGVHKSTISNIKRGANWKHISKEYSFNTGVK